MQVDAQQVAQHIDRLRRSWVVGRPDALALEIEGGWMLLRPGADPGEFASMCARRVYWFAPPSPPGLSAITAAANAAKAHGITRLFIWLAPWACSDETESALAAAGAQALSNVRYPALVRDALPQPGPIRTELVARPVPAAQAEAVMNHVSPWYSADGAAAAVRLVQAGVAELHAAFDGDAPVAASLLTLDGRWAYLGAAGTDPAHRGRGAQKALIRSRVERAAALGARHCVCETNSVVPISLHNLEVCGFREALAWRLFKWDLPGAA